MCCEQCSPERPGDAKGVPHYCQMCGGELKIMAGAHGAVPLWQRPLDFLRYPLTPIVLGLLILGAVPPFLLDGIPLLVALAVVLLLLSKYAYTALEYTASGRLEPVTAGQLGQAENTELAVSLGTLVLAAVGVVIYLGLKSSFWGGAVAALELVVLPAMIIAAAVDKNAASAFSGESLKAVLSALGLLYGAYVFLLMLLTVCLQSFVSLFADIVPLEFSRALAVLAYGYLFVVLMAASGYLIYTFQSELGFTPQHGKQRARRSRGPLLDPAAIAVDIYVKEGAYAKAVSTLRSETNRKGATLTVHERYHRLITALGDDTAMRQHASAYFKLLLESNRDSQALAMMREYLLRDSAFRPEDPDVCFDMAQAFLAMGEYKMAVHMVSGLHKDAPHYIRLPEAYLLAARVLNENLGLPQKSLALVQFLEGRFKTHKAFPEVLAYRNVLMQKPGSVDA